MATVGAVYDMQTNKLCLTLIDPTVYCDPVWVVKQQTRYMDIGDDPWFIAVCYCDHDKELDIQFQHISEVVKGLKINREKLIYKILELEDEERPENLCQE